MQEHPYSTTLPKGGYCAKTVCERTLAKLEARYYRREQFAAPIEKLTKRLEHMYKALSSYPILLDGLLEDILNKDCTPAQARTVSQPYIMDHQTLKSVLEDINNARNLPAGTKKPEDISAKEDAVYHHRLYKAVQLCKDACDGDVKTLKEHFWRDMYFRTFKRDAEPDYKDLHEVQKGLLKHLYAEDFTPIMNAVATVLVKDLRSIVAKHLQTPSVPVPSTPEKVKPFEETLDQHLPAPKQLIKSNSESNLSRLKAKKPELRTLLQPLPQRSQSSHCLTK